MMIMIQGANKPCERRRRSVDLLRQTGHLAQTNHRSGDHYHQDLHDHNHPHRHDVGHDEHQVYNVCLNA